MMVLGCVGHLWDDSNSEKSRAVPWVWVLTYVCSIWIYLLRENIQIDTGRSTEQFKSSGSFSNFQRNVIVRSRGAKSFAGAQKIGRPVGVCACLPGRLAKIVFSTWILGKNSKWRLPTASLYTAPVGNFSVGRHIWINISKMKTVYTYWNFILLSSL
jgi:hypothetical protein